MDPRHFILTWWKKADFCILCRVLFKSCVYYLIGTLRSKKNIEIQIRLNKWDFNLVPWQPRNVPISYTSTSYTLVRFLPWNTCWAIIITVTCHVGIDHSPSTSKISRSVAEAMFVPRPYSEMGVIERRGITYHRIVWPICHEGLELHPRIDLFGSASSPSFWPLDA